MLKPIEPIKLAKNKAILSGAVSTQELPRLLSEISGTAEITYVLRFDYDNEGRCVIAGKISAVLPVTCFRCLQPCQEALELNILLTPINSTDSKEEVADIYEPIVMEADSLDLWYLIEEEILLGLPLVPKHLQDDVNCIKTDLLVDEEVRLNAVKTKENPFKELINLTK